MARAVDNLSSSMPSHAFNVTSPGSAGSVQGLVFSPGGYSYGRNSSSRNSSRPSRGKMLRQARGTGRKTGSGSNTPVSPNKKSYSDLCKEAEETGGEVRM